MEYQPVKVPDINDQIFSIKHGMLEFNERHYYGGDPAVLIQFKTGI
jgi:hypothetical protein